jgi:hypothetical protein
MSDSVGFQLDLPIIADRAKRHPDEHPGFFFIRM